MAIVTSIKPTGKRTSCILSEYFAIIPNIPMPPAQTAIVLSQQQLVPRTIAKRPLRKVLLRIFIQTIWLLLQRYF